MPDLRALLDASASDLRQSAVPSYDDAVVPRVRRRRRQRLAASGATLALVVAATSGSLLLDGERDGLVPERVASAPPEGSVEEPRPFAVPTTPATEDLKVVRPSSLVEPVAPTSSVPWDLVRVWDSERRLAVQVSGDCDQTDLLRVVETDAFVAVQALDVDGPSSTACAVTTRWQVELRAPLGRRPLLHVAVSGRALLASRFVDLPPHPGLPWRRGLQDVPPGDLALFAGPEHCGWQDVAVLGGDVLRDGLDSRPSLWARDPDGILGDTTVRNGFRAPAVLPADARFTGYTHGIAQLWTAASDEGDAVYLVSARDRSDAERWARVRYACA